MKTLAIYLLFWLCAGLSDMYWGLADQHLTAARACSLKGRDTDLAMPLREIYWQEMEFLSLESKRCKYLSYIVHFRTPDEMRKIFQANLNRLETAKKEKRPL